MEISEKWLDEIKEVLHRQLAGNENGVIKTLGNGSLKEAESKTTAFTATTRIDVSIKISVNW